MTDSDITTTILRQIRDEIVQTRTELKAELAETKVEIARTIDATNERLDLMNERFGLVETTVKEAAEQVGWIVKYVKNKQDREIGELRERVTRLEEKVGA
jgi:hypothetical protein